MISAEASYGNILDTPERDAILSALSSNTQTALFSSRNSEITKYNLPFYQSFKLYRLMNYAALPLFQMDFLSDATHYYHLDGSVDPVYAANEIDPVFLSRNTILDYLQFVTENAYLEGHDLTLVRDIAQTSFFEALDDDDKITIQEKHHAPEIIAAGDNGNGFNVRATFIKDGVLMSATVDIDGDGKISLHQENMLWAGEYSL